MKVVAITGGGQGIGRAIAWHFAGLGYAIAITDSDRQAGLEALAHMRDMGANALFMPGDVFVAAHAGFMTGQNIIIDGGMLVKMMYAE